MTRGDLAVMLYRSLGSPASDSAKTEAGNEVSVGSYKGNTLSSGERSLLMIGTDAGTEFKVSSSAPSILALEQVSGNWVAVAKAPGTATVTITTVDGRPGHPYDHGDQQRSHVRIPFCVPGRSSGQYGNSGGDHLFGQRGAP